MNTRSALMSVQNPTWENQLLMWAQEALSSPRIDSHIETGEDILNSAYDYSARITRTNSATFYLASGLLAMFGLVDPLSPVLVVLFLPAALLEMVLAVWLIVKGFNSAALDAGSAKQVHVNR